MRPAQERAWAQHRHRFLLEVPRQELSTSVAPGAPLDLLAAYGRDAPLIVEIGSGTGESLVATAAQRPEANVLAFEVYQPALARLIASLVAQDITNVRVVEADAVDGLAHVLGPAAIDELWLFFPDPWPKARHHKRRLVTTGFADLVATRLRSGAHWRLATDWQDYAERMRAVLDAHPAFRNEHADWAPRWPDRPVTRFERRGLEAGRRVLDLDYRRL